LQTSTKILALSYLEIDIEAIVENLMHLVETREENGRGIQ